MKTIEQHIAKILNEKPENIIIEGFEFRENWKGQKLQSGNPVYYLSNQGVDGEPSKEFAGWLINGRFFRS